MRRPLVPLALVSLVALLLQLVAFADGWPRTIDLDVVTPDVAVFGRAAGDNFGYALAAGDFNGDGAADVLAGAHTASPSGRMGAGEAVVILGGDDVPGTIDLSTTAPGVRILGGESNAFLAYDLAAGDFNGDGLDDMILGAYAARPGGRLNAGEAFVVFGRPGLPSELDLAAEPADVSIAGAAADDRAGYSLAAGDLNGDGFGDIVIGAYTADAPGATNAGRVHVVLGQPEPPTKIDLDTSADFTILGAAAEDGTGIAVATGDVNGDGFDDVIAGADGGDTPGGFQAGRTYVIYGRSDLQGELDLGVAPADLTIAGDDTGDRSGSAVASGDINGDGYGDIIIGAHLANPPGGDEAGETYVLYGGPDLGGAIDLDGRQPGLAFYGDDARDRSGAALASGDVTGDGIDDLVVGAYFADPLGRIGSGETYIVAGGAGLPAVVDLDSMPADVILLGDDEFDTLGRAVAVGDVDADGAGDLIMGAPTADPGGRSGAGEVYVLRGKRGGAVEPTPTQPGGTLPGDANRDGVVDRVDALLILQFGAGLSGPLAGGDEADVDGDGAIDSRDAMLVLQYVAGLISSFG